MNPYQWTLDHSVGHRVLDQQHEELFRRTQRVLAAADGDALEMAGLIDFLHAYAVTHFGLEEGLMREVHYSGYARHKAEHDRFIADLVGLAGEYDRGGLSRFMRLRVREWLGGWLERHVREEDAALGAFLAGNGSARPGAPAGA